jgi:NADPH-dependent 2,4-dienoyl-CoA reductase/sulfur reductase-like enzyme
VPERLVIIGGDAGGMSAAAQVRRMRAEDDLEIVVFERGEFTSFAACGLPYLVGGEVAEADDLVARSPEQFRASGIDVRTGHLVESIDTAARTVTVRDLGADTTSVEGYDELLIATGAVPVRPPLPGIDAPGVFDLRTIPDGVALDAAVGAAAAGTGRAVVVGAGYIGLEVAEAFARRGLQVVVVEMADQPMVTLDADMAERVTAAVERMGVELRLGAAVESFATDGDGRVRAVVTSAGEVPAEVVVVGLGARPNAALAEAAGIPIGASGGIVVDDHQRTGVEHVWAAGDCVESFHRVSRRGVNVALGTHANKQGRTAGTNLGGGDATFGGVLGTAITRVGDVEVARTGLNEREAADAGFEVVTATATAPSTAHYYPGGEEMAVKLVAERGSGRLLGGQIVGGRGAGKRIDVLATALWNEMRVEELAGVDLAYAPPFSPVWDPVLLAAGRTVAALDRAR